MLLRRTTCIVFCIVAVNACQHRDTPVATKSERSVPPATKPVPTPLDLLATFDGAFDRKANWKAVRTAKVEWSGSSPTTVEATCERRKIALESLIAATRVQKDARLLVLDRFYSQGLDYRPQFQLVTVVVALGQSTSAPRISSPNGVDLVWYPTPREQEYLLRQVHLIFRNGEPRDDFGWPIHAPFDYTSISLFDGQGWKCYLVRGVQLERDGATLVNDTGARKAMLKLASFVQDRVDLTKALHTRLWLDGTSSVEDEVAAETRDIPLD